MKVLIIDQNLNNQQNLNKNINYLWQNAQIIIAKSSKKGIELASETAFQYIFINISIQEYNYKNIIRTLLEKNYSENNFIIVIEKYDPEIILKLQLENINNYIPSNEITPNVIQKTIDCIISEVNSKDKENSYNQQIELIQNLATHDSLTHLPNKFYFLDKLHHLIIQSDNNDNKLAILLIDLDGFKAINDFIGHDAGDNLLKLVSKRLLSIKGQNTILARFGGDEFGFIVPNIENLETIEIFSEEILNSFTKPFDIGVLKKQISTSIGIAIYPLTGTKPDDLIKNADIAMYCAKDAGKNCYRFFDSKMQQEHMEKYEIVNDLNFAISRSEFTLHIQPQYELKNNNLIGVETLIRWVHHTKGIIMPDKFIPIAEESGKMSSISSIVISQTLALIDSYRKTNNNNIRFALNVSPSQFNDDTFLQQLEYLVSLNKDITQMLSIEITENLNAENIGKVSKMLSAIKKLGILISLDDFGLGYSSLHYLSKLPADVIKIAKPLIDDIETNKKSKAIVKALIDTANQLNILTIAEGIENKNQHEILLKMGCYAGQGFFYSKPVSKDTFFQSLKNH